MTEQEHMAIVMAIRNEADVAFNEFSDALWRDDHGAADRWWVAFDMLGLIAENYYQQKVVHRG